MPKIAFSPRLRSCPAATSSLPSPQTLLKTKSTKAAMVRWLAGVINGNSGRAKLQIDNNAVATDGFFANLSLGGSVTQSFDCPIHQLRKGHS